MRAVFLREQLAELGTVLGPARAHAVIRSLGPAFCQRIAGSSEAWHPIARELDLVETIDGVLGRAAMRAWAHDHGVAVARRGTFGAIVNQAIRLFGVSPHGMSWAAARAWAHTYEGMGRLVQDGSDRDAVVLRWLDAPAWVAEHTSFRASLEAAVGVCLTLSQRDGEVRLGLEGGALRFVLKVAPLRVAS